MKSIRHIGVYLPDGDHTDPGVRHAEAMAIKLDARLTLLSALPIARKSPRSGELTDLDKKRLEKIAARLTIPTETVVLGGPPADKLRVAVTELGLHLLVKTARKRSVFDRIVGRVASELLGSCPCPLWVVSRDSSVLSAPVVAAVNAVGWSGEGESLRASRRVISLGAELAAATESRLIVAHAWDPLGPRIMARSSSEELDAYLYEERRLMERDLNDLVVAALGVKQAREVELELVEGLPAPAITALAERVGTQTIVMGTRERGFLSRLFVESTTQQVIDLGAATVIATRAA